MTIEKLLNIKYPIIQGAMAYISLSPLVGAVSNAGGLGIIASGGMNASLLRNEIHKCKSLTNNTFGVNLMMMADNIDELVEVVIEEGIKIVTTGAGSPEKYLPSFKKAGIITIPVVATLKQALKMNKLGVDAIIVEGMEAGGHIGELTTMGLLPQVVDAVSVPVIAAGGIYDGRGVVAAYALGAKGVQMGTRFIATTECSVHENYKQAIINARDNATTVTGKNIGIPVRSLKNTLTENYAKLENNCNSKDEMEKLMAGSLRKAAQDGDIDNGSVMAGQNVSAINKVLPVAELIEQIMNETKNVIKKLTI